MAVAALAQRVIALPADRIELNGDVGPMVEGIAQPVVAGLAAPHDAAPAAATGDRGGACQGSQKMIVSLVHRLPSLGEQRGEGDPSEPWTGTQDRHVALLADLPRRGLPGALDGAAERIEPVVGLL